MYPYLSRVNEVIKGKTTCPKCQHEFILDLPENLEKHEVICPKCENKFTIQAKCSDPKLVDECSWEEYGEPRKTVLSSIKPKTNKLMIVVILLSCVFAIGLITAVFSDAFIESSMNLTSDIGLTGSIKILVTDSSNNTLSDINVTLNNITSTTNENGIFFVENIKLGIQTLKFSGDGYKTQTCEILVIPIFILEKTVELEAGVGQGSNVNFDYTGCSLILAIFSVFGLLGTITCLKKQHADVAIMCSLISIFSFGFFFIGSILSIIAFIFIMKNRDEFEDGKKGKIF